MSFINTLNDINDAGSNLSDVFSTDTFAGLRGHNAITWHLGDVGIVTGNNDSAQGTYVYVGLTNGDGYKGQTAANDWQILATPPNAVQSVAGETGTVSKTQLLTAINVQDGAGPTPINGIYLDPTSASVGQIPKIELQNVGGTMTNVWGVADDDSEAGAIDITSTPSAASIQLSVTGGTTPITLTTASGTQAGIVTNTQFTSWENKLSSATLGKVTKSATVVANQTVYTAASDFVLGVGNTIEPQHRLSYNGLVLSEGAGNDYTRASDGSSITLTAATLAALDVNDELLLENTTLTLARA